MASITGLHLQYRLWIAEMNADINVLRIFDDYLFETAKENSDDAVIQVNNFKEQFLKLRNDIDALKHEMHLSKMKLAALAKTNDTPVKNIEGDLHHDELKERYNVFRKKFHNTKKAFREFEDKEYFEP